MSRIHNTGSRQYKGEMKILSTDTAGQRYLCSLVAALTATPFDLLSSKIENLFDLAISPSLNFLKRRLSIEEGSAPLTYPLYIQSPGSLPAPPWGPPANFKLHSSLFCPKLRGKKSPLLSGQLLLYTGVPGGSYF
jgi:hypothetical protein